MAKRHKKGHKGMAGHIAAFKKAKRSGGKAAHKGGRKHRKG